MTTIRAARLHALDTPLRLEDIPRPEPGPGEVRLRVEACALNFADTLLVRGRYQERPALPFTPGLEVAGTLETGPEAGRRVAAYCGLGGLAEAVCVPAARCVPLPDAMPVEVGASLLIAHSTAEVALTAAALTPGARLVVSGAAGGLGLATVEIGRIMGAEIVATARDDARLAVAQAAGATHLLRDDADLTADIKALGGADVVVDTTGGQFEALMRATRPGARLVPAGFAAGPPPRIPAEYLLVKNLTVIGLYWGALAALDPPRVAASIARVFAWWAAGEIGPTVETLPLERAEEGLQRLRDRTAIGKVVIHP